MRTVVATLLLSLTLGATAAYAADSAMPESPSAFGKAASVEAAGGELAQSLAHGGAPGAGDEVQYFRALNDSTPNPPAANSQANTSHK